MAEYILSYQRLTSKEGGHSNNFSDRGGETWKGIARRYHPDWIGWAIVDSLRQQAKFPGNLAFNLELEHAVYEFYRQEFWLPLLAEQLPQLIADELLEASVNCGKHNGVKFLQNALNLLNRNQRLYADIEVDGYMGRDTLGAVQQCLQTRSLETLWEFQNHMQANYYTHLLLTNPDQEEFSLGWFARTRQHT